MIISFNKEEMLFVKYYFGLLFSSSFDYATAVMFKKMAG